MNIKKCYTDGHERDKVVKDINDQFLVAYFTAERRAYRWVQIDETVAVKLEEKDPIFPRKCSHQYNCQTSSLKREYRVDNHSSLAKYIPEADIQFGGSQVFGDLLVIDHCS